MAKREKFSAALNCDCGKAGRGEWEENENHVEAGGFDRITLGATPPFIVQPDGSINCSCGQRVAAP